MSQNRTRSMTYILLKNTRFLTENQKVFFVFGGEILEKLDQSYSISGFVDVSSRKSHQLRLLDTFSTEVFARLTEFEAENLREMSLEDRLRLFQKLRRFKKPPETGSKVFVTTDGIEYSGVVEVVFVGGEIMVKVEGCTRDRTPMTCGLDESHPVPGGNVTWNVPTNPTRATRSRMPRVKSCTECPFDGTAPLGLKHKHRQNELAAGLVNKKCKRDDFEKRLQILVKRLAELKMYFAPQLAAEQKAHEEMKRILVSTQNDLENKEIGLANKRISDELTLQQQKCKEFEIKSKELERQLACEEKARKDAKDQLQDIERKSKELEVTLAAAQKSLKNKRNSENEHDWLLNRDEIHLTEVNLGSGHFGTVYKGMFRETLVAVKQLSMKPRITDYNKESFRREMRMAARCRHPCMLQFIGATSDDQSPLLVTELLDTSLKDVLLERALEPNEIKTIALDVAKGLNYLHLNQPNPIVHRDISSGNVLLWKHGESWRGKVSDYGNAVMMNYAKTGSGGAIPYLAPEIEKQRFSTKSDVYSYGVLLLEMCVRKNPSCLDDRDELICLVENGDLRSLIRDCLQEDPLQRLSMKEIISRLNELISDLTETQA